MDRRRRCTRGLTFSVCARREGKKEREPVRKEEWKLDVPTIGFTYAAARSVVYYYSGLGLPFQISNLQSPTHWLNRAWTLQELRDDSFCFIAGISRVSPLMPSSSDASSIPIHSDEWTFYRRIDALPRNNYEYDILGALDAMRQRSAKSELDRIAGLNYMVPSEGVQGLPIYVVGEEPEDAWRRFVKVNHDSRTSLFWRFPYPGAGTSNNPAWFPSWQRVIDAARILPCLQQIISISDASLIIHPPVPVEFDTSRKEYRMNAPTTECYISGFAEPDAERPTREGVVTIQSTQAHTRTLVFRAVVDHDQFIPDGDYTLLLQPEAIAAEREASGEDEASDKEETSGEEEEDTSGEEEEQVIGGPIAGLIAGTKAGGKVEHLQQVGVKDDTWFGPVQGEMHEQDKEEMHEHSGGIIYIQGVMGHMTLEGAFKKTTTINIKRDRTRFQVLKRSLVLA